IIARLLSPGPNNPSGFILTTLLGIAGAFLATFIGQAVGWYRLDQGAGFVGATVGALLVLFIWNRLVVHRVTFDPGGRWSRGRPRTCGTRLVENKEAYMGLLDILKGMENGPRGQRQPSSGTSSGMSPLTMALLGVLAYKALKHIGGAS